ncbi:MAG TPA: antitoxin Xre-like helix-turn-helix domain-containing protein [Acetobacteraceae bacterium]|jgi:hypothetical protein
MTEALPRVDSGQTSPTIGNESRGAARARSRAHRKALSATALRAFFGLAALWKLNVPQQMALLGVTARSTFLLWKKHPDVALPKDTMERISYLLGIDNALRIMLPPSVAADVWLRQPNQAPPFSGGAALDRMLLGNVADLFEVYRYLDEQRAGFVAGSRESDVPSQS